MFRILRQAQGQIGLYLPCGKNDNISEQLRPVLELDSSLGESLNLTIVLQLDLAVYNQLARTNIYIRRLYSVTGLWASSWTHQDSSLLPFPMQAAKIQSRLRPKSS